MADNIKIIGTILNTSTVSRYDADDINLIPITTLKEYFGGADNYIEYYVYDAGSNLLNTNYNYLDYKLPTTTGLKPNTVPDPNIAGNIQTNNVGIVSTLDTGSGAIYPIIEIDPVKDIQSFGYSSGEFKVRYNLFQNKISNPTEKALYVKEISQDRTEIRLASTTLTDADIETATNILISEINSTPTYYVDYLLNFGDNQQYVAVNVALNKAATGYEVLFKLYNPLPLEVQEKSTLWVVQEQASPYLFDINLDKLITLAPGPKLRGPNFDIATANQNTISTAYNNYSGLITSLQSLQQTSYRQILNLMATQSVDINVDYTDYTDFIFFGSAYQRLSNFYTKAKQIEDYNTLISTYSPQSSSIPSLITEINQYASNINTLVSQFDGYEYYLYFESSSYAWPKTNSTRPFSLLSTGSATVISWYTNQTSSAQTYDYNNYDNLEYAIPTFVKDDDTNQPYLLFLNMVGHYFDNIWVYIKAITDVNLANNNLEQGISKDLVYDRLKSLGIKLYNSQAGEGVDQYLIGANTGSSVFNNNFTITGSYLNNIPRKDLVSELYKRLYHNLPLLVKTKGTVVGLEYLDTIFGITSSILNVKEFGGSIKSNLVKGYNEDKVRIIPNTIENRAVDIYTTASVLSNELSLQTFPTASNQFRDNDMHYVDISFSPQTQIDTYISGAIASNNPTWILDNYIGDPRQQYSSSYSDLDAQRKLYFETGVAGFNPFTASLLDYNGFVRLIEFFDNSLFKMLSDFVPERASLSTGITINSPVLERNKSVYSVPTATEQTVYDAEYPAPGVSAQYGKLYDDLSGDKKQFYTGELSGSVVDVYQYFTDNNNPYLGDWDVYNSQHNITQSINRNTFNHSDWNVLLNNVSKSVESNVRKKIEYVWGTTGSITSSAELQDSYLSLRSYNVSRYEGSKTTSLLYNTYTSASSTYVGDDSFGKTAAIDLQSLKVGWVKNIPSSSLNFYDKTSIDLKYLVDKDNFLNELSLANYNLVEVQNTFKSGTPVVLSISDVQVPSNQTSLNGLKTIFKGGFSYDPILYRELNETLTFRHETPISSTQGYLGIKAQCDNNYTWATGTTQRLTGTGPNKLSNQLGGGWDKSEDGNSVYYINNVFADPNTQAIAYSAIPASSWNSKYSLNIALNNTFPAASIFSGRDRTDQRLVYAFNILNFNNILSNTESNPQSYSLIGERYFYKVPRTGQYKLEGIIPFYLDADDNDTQWYKTNSGVRIKVVGVVESSSNINSPDSQWTYVANTTLSNPISFTGPVVIDKQTNAIRWDNSVTLLTNCTLDNTVTLKAGDYIRFQFYIIDNQSVFYNTKRIKFSINNIPGGSLPTLSYLEIKYLDVPFTIFNYESTYGQLPPLFTQYNSNTIVFDATAQQLLNAQPIFIPSLPAKDYYSPVVDLFTIQKYDLFRVGQFNSPTSKYYEVADVYISNNKTYVTFNGTFDSTFNSAVSFAILRPKPNETSVIINYIKQPGEVAQTILVPYDANDTIKNSVGNIFKTLNTNLK